MAVPALDARMMPTAPPQTRIISTQQRHSSDTHFNNGVKNVELLALVSVHAMYFQQSKKGLTNQSVQGQSLGENEDEDHSHKELGLLCICSAQEKNSQALSL